MRLSRSRRFFFPLCSDPSPSTSVNGRHLFAILHRDEDLVGCDGEGGGEGEEKQSRRAGVGPAVKVKALGVELDLASCQANLILTVHEGQHGRKPGEFVRQSMDGWKNRRQE